MQKRERMPAYPHLNPTKLRCPEGTHRVMGWVYEDGTIEMPCRDFAPNGKERHHLFNPENGEAFTIDLEKPERAAPCIAPMPQSRESFPAKE